MAAKVTAADRAKTKQKTGDDTFPCQTAAQIESAIRLRHNGHKKGPAAVLQDCTNGLRALKRAGKISPAEFDRISNKIAEARKADATRGKS